MTATSPLIITPRTVRRPELSHPGVLARAPFVAIDVETTGMSEDCRVIEIAAARYSPDGCLIDTYQSLTNPGANVPLSPAAQKIHGITPAQVRTAPPIDTVLVELRDFVAGHGLVAHNLNFESRFLSGEYHRLQQPPPQWQGVCTLAAARRHFTFPSNKLSALIEAFKLPAINSHRALDDAKACGLLLSAMMTARNLTDLEPLGAPQDSDADARPRKHIDLDAPSCAPTAGRQDTVAAFSGVAPTDE